MVAKIFQRQTELSGGSSLTYSEVTWKTKINWQALQNWNIIFHSSVNYTFRKSFITTFRVEVFSTGIFANLRSIHYEKRRIHKL